MNTAYLHRRGAENAELDEERQVKFDRLPLPQHYLFAFSAALCVLCASAVN